MQSLVSKVRLGSWLTLLLTACGGGGGGGFSPPPLPPPPPPPPPPLVDPIYLASGQSPFTANCDGVASSGTLYVNAEVEPYLAVNPLAANNLVGTWQQDRWSDGSSRGIVSAVSFDGGVNWTRRPMPFSRCGGDTPANGGDYARATDPWVSFGPDGTAYLMALASTGGTFQPGSVNAMLVSRSLDRGRSWSMPITLIRDGAGFFNDKNTITADPTNARLVYATWDRLAPNGNGPAYFARTIDGGNSWEPARAIYNPGGINQTIGNEIVVLPDGTLVDLFTEIDTAANGSSSSSLAVIRSLDKGVSWSAPTRIASLLAVGVRDPQTGTPVRDGSDLAHIATNGRGQLFVVWQDARFSNGNIDGIVLSRSTNGGLNWSAPQRVNAANNVFAFMPSVHVRADSTIGVTYYDLRSDTADRNTLLTDYWLARSGDGGVSWRETRVAPAFDLDSAPFAEGYFLGDYQALGSRGAVFVPFFVRTTGVPTNRTDVYAAPAVSVTSSLIAVRPAAMADAASSAPRMSAGFSRRVSDNLARNMRARRLGRVAGVPSQPSP